MNTLYLVEKHNDQEFPINSVNFLQDADITYIDVNAIVLKTNSGTQQVYGKPCSVKIENSGVINGTDISGFWGDNITFSYTIDVPSAYTDIDYSDVAWDTPVYLSSRPTYMAPWATWQGPGMYSSGYTYATSYEYSVVVTQNGEYYDEYYQSGFYQGSITLSERENVISATSCRSVSIHEAVTVYGERADGVLYINTISGLGGWSLSLINPSSGECVPEGTTYIYYGLEAENDPVGIYDVSSVRVVLLDESGSEVARSRIYYRPDGGGSVAEMASLQFEMPQRTTTVTLKVVSA